jgi:acetyl esterase
MSQAQIDEVFSSRFHLLEGHPEHLTNREIIRLVAAQLDAPFSEYVSPPVDVENREIPGPQGPIPVRIYWPKGARTGTAVPAGSGSPSSTTSASKKLPGVVWFHGGAFLFGGLDMNEADTVSRELAHRAGAVVMSVDYRLVTTEAKFPVCQIDALAAALWFKAHTDELLVDSDNIVIGGGSAGAALTASTILRLRDLGEQAGLRTMLIYPTLHSTLPEFTAEHAEKLASIPSAFTFDPAWTAWIRDQLGAESVDPSFHINPGDSSNLEGIPETLIINSEYDALRSSGEQYGRQLSAAGNKVTMHMQKGAIHGHLNRHPGESWSMDQSLILMADFISSQDK